MIGIDFLCVKSFPGVLGKSSAYYKTKKGTLFERQMKPKFLPYRVSNPTVPSSSAGLAPKSTSRQEGKK